MSVIDYNRIASTAGDQKDCLAFCVQFAKELPQALKKAGTEIQTRDARYAAGCAVVDRTAVKTGGFLSPKIAEFYCIFAASATNWSGLSMVHFGACISTSGRYFFEFDELNAEQFGRVIAEACGYDKDLAERVLYDAIAGNFWTLDDIWAAQDKNGGPDIQVQGEGNVVAGRDAYRR